jgi:hypothetical protein
VDGGRWRGEDEPVELGEGTEPGAGTTIGSRLILASENRNGDTATGDNRGLIDVENIWGTAATGEE